MAEEEDKQEEKFDFTAQGEALAYISLDQARVLAMEHARDNREFYGQRYATHELVWEVASQAESEDYYDIRLSYRPARGFTGAPGIEQFTIDKAGPIRIRQILSEPRRRTRMVPALVLAGVIGVAAAVVGALFALGGIRAFRFQGLDQDAAIAPTVSTLTPETLQAPAIADVSQRTVHSYLDISLPVDLADQVTEVGVTFEVERTWLNEQKVIRDEAIELWRYSGGWERLPTEGGPVVEYQAVAEGLSEFAIVAVPVNLADFDKCVLPGRPRLLSQISPLPSGEPAIDGSVFISPIPNLGSF